MFALQGKQYIGKERMKISNTATWYPTQSSVERCIRALASLPRPGEYFLSEIPGMTECCNGNCSTAKSKAAKKKTRLRRTKWKITCWRNP